MRYRFRKDRRRLDKRAFFLSPPTAPNEFNEAAGDYTAAFDRKCALYPAPGTERYANKENVSTAPVLIEVRDESVIRDLNTDYRVVVDGKTYEIVSLDQPERGANWVVAAVNNGV